MAELGESGAADAVSVLEQRGYIARAGAPGAWGRQVIVTAEGGTAYHTAAGRLASAERRWLDLAERAGIDALAVLRTLTEAAELLAVVPAAPERARGSSA